ncbi:MAG: response regulator, partial [Desulfovibrio sp.]|nr:response regulator [Desulfovibrio sp.]
MPVVTIFSGAFCQGDEVARLVAQGLGCPLLDDADLLARVSQERNIAQAKLAKAAFGKPSVFNQFSHEKERTLSWLKVGLAKMLEQTDLVYSGFCAHLVPHAVSHALSVCLIAEFKHRLRRAMDEMKLSEREAAARLRKEDEGALQWVEYLHGREAWSSDLYDMLIPMDKHEPTQAAALIVEHAQGGALRASAASRQAHADFALAAAVEAALAASGHNTHDLAVAARRGRVTIQVNKHVMMLGRLESELAELAGRVPGVEDLAVQPGPGYHQADVYRRADFELPSKVMLVDDEREFAQTLSERLLMREIGSAVAYDGQQALEMAGEDEPEVMVLDLRMPGIDGIEV